MRTRVLFSLLLLVGLLIPSSAAASLTTFATFVGSDGVSTDGCGSTSSGCTLTASVPAGSTVLAAYLYTSLSSTGTPGGTLSGSPVSYTALGVNNGFLQAWRADVTATVAAVVGSGGAAPFNFAVTETASGSQDGEALVVVYSNPSLPTQTVGILDGFSASTGDSASINFATPLDPTAPGFLAEMRIGDGFSFDGPDPLAPFSTQQTSVINVNGQLLTNVAGHCDDAKDATCANGNLITVGGWNDPLAPLNPTVGQDHERYNLTPLITPGDMSIGITTRNASGDDNIFLEVFLVTGAGGVNAPPPVPGPQSPVPEPTTLSLLGIGVVGAWRRLRRK